MNQAADKLDNLAINTIRMLAVDMVEKANSGHPGMPLGAAPLAYAVFSRFLRHNPANPDWPDRDRFILSAGHGSAMLYAVLHLSGYDLSLEDLQNFRQWGSKTAGHPEYGLCPGVEATTGPLGQGFAMGVGMALAERFLAQCFNRDGLEVVNHYTYAIVSDGDLMEGVTSEAASLAGTLGLGKLIYLYDDNHISIEGPTDLTFTEDVGTRFEAYDWQVLTVDDGNDLAAIVAAVEAARAEKARPSLIKVRTHIGFGSPKVDMPSAHGEPLGAEALAQTRRALGWPDESFHVPARVRAKMGEARQRGQQQEDRWRKLMDDYRRRHPELAEAFYRQMAGELPADYDALVPELGPGDGPLATRAASGKVLGALAQKVGNLIGGSADLAPSNKTMIEGSPDVRPGQAPGGRNIHFGVREHAMGAMINGMALHGGVYPYGGTFLVFADYLRPALRLAALMQTHAIFIFTHDSLGVGEDGPTHQPVEQVASLRAIPGFKVMRPADAGETAACWRLALTGSGPCALVLTRQKLPVLDPAQYPVASGPARGAYVLSDCQGPPRLLLLATGSEVALALEAQAALAEQGVAARVVSMPCWELFAAQDQAYRDTVLPPEVTARLGIEAGVSLGWRRWVGDGGDVIAVDRFGASAPGDVVLAEYGFNLDNVLSRALALLG